MAILEVNRLEKNFGSTEVLTGINFSLERGEVLAIIGSSGSGKTTLLRCLNFLETPSNGRILVNGEPLFDAADPATQREGDIRRKRLHFGLVFQSFNLFPHRTVLRNVTLAGELEERFGLPVQPGTGLPGRLRGVEPGRDGVGRGGAAVDRHHQTVVELTEIRVVGDLAPVERRQDVADLLSPA